MAITDGLLEYYKEGSIRLDYYLRSLSDKQLLANYLNGMNDLMDEQKRKIMSYPTNQSLRRGLEHMTVVKEKVWIRYNQINKGGLYE